MRMPSKSAVESCLVAILTAPAGLVPAVSREFMGALNAPIPLNLPAPNIELATRMSRVMVPYVRRELPVPDTTDFEDLIRPAVLSSIDEAVSNASGATSQIATRAVADFFRAQMDKASDEAKPVAVTIEKWRAKVLQVAAAAALQGSTIAVFIQGEGAAERVVRAAYDRREVAGFLLAMFTPVISPETLGKMFEPMAKADFPGIDPETLKAALAEQIETVSQLMRSALDGAVENTVNGVYSN
jgi:hypothetical protein